jgi:hypothetical protein
METARGYSQQALALAREVGSKRDIAAAINVRGHIHRLEGALDAAEPLYETVVTLGRELGDRDTTAVGLLNLAMVAIARGSVEQTSAMLLDVVAIADEIGSKSAGQSVLEVAAGLAALRKDWDRAARLYGAADANMFYTGIVRDAADEAFLAPLVAKARDALGEPPFAAAKSGGRALSYEQAMGEVRTWLRSTR